MPALALPIAGAVVAIGGAYPVNPIVRACDPDPTPRFERQQAFRVACDLDPIGIGPVVTGPRHRGAVSYARVAEQIVDELNESQIFHGGPFNACYRWARWAKPDLAGDLTMGIQVDEWGRIARAVAPADPIDRDLATCFADALAGMRVAQYTPRRTTMSITFRVAQSGQARLKQRPAPPARLKPATGGQHVCVEQPAVLPTDVVAGPAPVVVVDNFSKDQDDQEKHEKYRAEMKAWIAGGRSGPAPVNVPDVIPCYARLRGKPNRPDVAAAVSFQRGDFQACYAEATARGHGAGGEVALVALVNRAGQFEDARVRTSTTRDAQLDRCLAGPLAHTHVATGLGGIFEVRVLLRLAPAAGGGARFGGDDEETAGDAVDDLDANVAYDRARGALARAPAGRRCAVATVALQAALTAAPWQDDERVSAAVDGVRAAMRAAPGPTLATCQKLASPLLAAWAARPFELGQATHRPDILAVAADRMQRLLAFEPALPNAGLLRVLRGEALVFGSRWLEAGDQLLAAARDGGIPEAWAADAADGAAWAYARGLIGPQHPDHVIEALHAGPPPEALARHPEVATRLQAALALRKPELEDPKFPWLVGHYRSRHASTTERIAALKGLLPDPPITALQARDAWTYLRSLRIARLPDLVCHEARRLFAASVAKTEGDRRRLKAFVDACRLGP